MQKPTKPQRSPLAEVATSEAIRLACDPNIAGVGFGLKFVQGKPMLSASLQYFVRAKLASDDEITKLGSTRLPSSAGGYQTDVIQLPLTRILACPGSQPPTGERGGRKEDPLVGGTSTTTLGDFHSFPTGYGTLGGICFDEVTGMPMALSNAHVYGDQLGADGIQPWLPASEYLEGALKYLFCGGPLAHLFFWTAPSDLTVLLTMGAAAAWMAAIASDAEDPSRWGQRTGAVPPAGARTERERIRITAEVPHLPFPGRPWRSKTRWDYTRHTTGGDTATSVEEERPNQHALVGKRVFTDRTQYRGGDRVTLCAELWTRADVAPVEHFVVAHCFPTADTSRVTRRVLVPGILCARIDSVLDRQRQPRCVSGFAPQVAGLAQMNFPVVAPPFIVWSTVGSTVLDSGALRIPPDAALNVTCPPSTHVEVDVLHASQRVRATAFSASGVQVAQAESTGAPGADKLPLVGPEIVRVMVDGGGGEGFLAGICVDKRMIQVERSKAISRYYTGSLDLALREPAGTWAVVVIAQTLDDTPTGGDPLAAARRLSGIISSANVVEVGECVCTMLYDATFDVSDRPPPRVVIT